MSYCNECPNHDACDTGCVIGAARRIPTPNYVPDEKRLELQSMPEHIMRLAKDQFGTHFILFEVWVGEVIDKAFDIGKAAASSEIAPKLPETMPDVHDTLIDAERYRWLRAQSTDEQITAIERANGSDHLLDHFIDKGRCGL